jgi:zinc protease
MTVKELSNGFNVVCINNPSSEVVSLQVWVKCGSVYETKGEEGVSHFIEHLLFKGSQGRLTSGIAEAVESLGGELNAFTGNEYTCYYITIPSMRTVEGLNILKDLVFKPAFIAEEIDAEREVILEEIRRYRDIPSSVVSDNYFEIQFKDHPYSHPILGFESVIKGISRDAIIDYYSRFYNSTNTMLVICGNIPDEEKLFLELEKIYSDISPALSSKNPFVEDAKIKTEGSCKIAEMDVNEATVMLGFSIPGLMHKDVPALDILGITLGQGESSRLFKSVRQDKGLVTSIYSYAYTPKHGGSFNIAFSIDGKKPGLSNDISKVLLAIYEEVEKVRSFNITEEELQKAKTIVLSEKIYEREKVEGLASKIGHLISVAGDIEFENRYLEALKNVNGNEILSVIDKYLDYDAVSISAVLPKDSKIKDNELLLLYNDVFSKKPKENKKGAKKGTQALNHNEVLVKSMELNAVIECAQDMMSKENMLVEAPKLIKHDSGAKIISRKVATSPIVSFKVLMPGGTIFENEANQGISNLVSRTLMFDTENLTYSDIVSQIDNTASSLSVYSARNTIGLNITSIKPFFPKILDIAEEVLLKPKFNKAYFATEKKIIEDEIKAIQDNLSQYARVLLFKTLYKEHPYRMETCGTLSSMKNIKRADVMSFYDKLLTPEKMLFSVVGDINEDDVHTWIDDFLSKLSRKTILKEPERNEPEQVENRITKFNKETQQAHIYLAYKTCPLSSRDRFALNVLYAVLGGQSGRLFVNLRDKQSLAYSVSPVEMFGIDTGLFAVYIASENNKIDRAISGIRKELDIIKTDKVSNAEIERAKNFLIGRHAIGMQSLYEQASAMAFDEAYGLGYSSIMDYSKEIMDISSEDVIDVASKYFVDGRENIAIVSTV